MRVYLLLICIALMSACKPDTTSTAGTGAPPPSSTGSSSLKVEKEYTIRESYGGEYLSNTPYQEEKKRIADSLCAQFPIDSVQYSPKDFELLMSDAMQNTLYHILMKYATQEEIDICHDLPSGNMIDYGSTSFLSLILSVAIANQKLIEQLTGGNPTYSTPQSTKLINYFSDDASIRFMRVIDTQFTLEEKTWLRKIGGNTALVDKEDAYFVTQMAAKILVKLLYQQKQLNELISSLQKK